VQASTDYVCCAAARYIRVRVDPSLCRSESGCLAIVVFGYWCLAMGKARVNKSCTLI
jgi:hypothetical protein